MVSERQANDYFNSFIPLNPVYVWGANITNIKEQSDSHAYMMKLYKTYGSTNGQYNQAYYEKKYQQAISGSGWISDCSGFMAKLSSVDRTAAGFYQHSSATGTIDTIDLNHSCLLFRGSNSKITHVGFYNNETQESIEMANSQDNFRHQKFNPKNWTFWGRPDFIDYSIIENVSVTPTYLYKGIDISSYQKNLNYKALKDAGVDFAILKIINKQGNKDSMYDQHCLNLDALGIKIPCVYNYSYAINIDQAVYMANKVIEYLGTRQCAICLDVEDNCQKTLGSGLIDIINAYQSVVEASGRAFILYTGLSFFRSYIQPYSANLKCKQYWIARYNRGYNSMDFDEDPDENYKPMNDIVAWQYTSSGIIKGIDCRLDLNVMYKEIELPSSTPVIIPTPIPTLPDTSQLNPLIKNTVKTNGKRLNVRNKPTTDSDIVGKMTNGSNVVIYGVDKTGQWARLSVEKDLWSSTDYISSTGKGIVTAEKSLYIRSSDSKSGEVWGVYKANTIVKILHQSTNTGWYLTVGIDKDGKQIGGWCSNNYIQNKR